jgi:hypothetical protein
VKDNEVTLVVLHRRPSLDSLDLPASYGFASLEAATPNDGSLDVELEPEGDRRVLRFTPTLEMGEGSRLSLLFAR